MGHADRTVHLLDGRLERFVTPDDDLSCLAGPASCQLIPDDMLTGEGDEMAEAVVWSRGPR